MWDVEHCGTFFCFIKCAISAACCLCQHLPTHSPSASMDFHTVCFHDTCFLKRMMDVLMGIFGGSAAAAPNGILMPFVQANVSTSPTLSNEHSMSIVYTYIYIYTQEFVATAATHCVPMCKRKNRLLTGYQGGTTGPWHCTIFYLAIVTVVTACKSDDDE